MYGCVPLRCCDFYPVWEHFPQFKYPRLGAKWLKNHTLSGSKGSRKYTVVLSASKNLKRVYPFGSIFAENDTRLGSKNGENYTLSSGTYPVPKTSKCPPPPGGNNPLSVTKGNFTMFSIIFCKARVDPELSPTTFVSRSGVADS